MNKKLLFISLLAILIFSISTIAFSFYISIINENSINNTSMNKETEKTNDSNEGKKELQDKETIKLDKDIFTFVLFGTDERNNEKSRTDSIMLIQYNIKTKNANIISIPRDTRVEIPGKSKDKINAAYAYGGYPLAIETLENLLETKIDYYARVNFYSFIEIIDTLGGVKVNAKKDIIWKDSDFKKTFHIKKGEQILNGEDALIYVRFRKDSDGDFGRIQRQQEVLLSIATDILKPNTIIKLPKLTSLLNENVESNIDWKTLLKLGLEIKDINEIQIETHMLKTHSKIINKVWYELIDKSHLEELKTKIN